MGGNVDFTTAMTNRSLRTIKTELEFLADNQIITSHQLNAILNHLPLQTTLHGPISPSQEVAPPTGPIASVTAPPSLPHCTSTANSVSTTKSPSFAEKTASFNEKAQPPPTTGYYAQQQQQPEPAPPAYTPSILTHATALYTYTPTDAGDLALNPHDRVAVSEYMNAEWWKGKNLSTNAEGIFPRSYVKVEENHATSGAASKSQAGTSGYGNMPLEVSQSGSGPSDPRVPSKGEEQGKKFGKKLGNAAIFGAGATIGGKIVNGIF